MEQLNLLVNAGHNPSSLARQMVRYLRNALMAKLGGEETELLQISADERARAARTALLFTEEELTRNLQIVLRTFDDLNYRQEQRFHLELGLLKLIHAQRLLPIEELLSGVVGSSGARNPAAHGVPRSNASPHPSPAASSSRPPAASAPAAPSISPIRPGGWSPASSPKQSADESGPVAEMERPSPYPRPSLPLATPATGYASHAQRSPKARWPRLLRPPRRAISLPLPPSTRSATPSAPRSSPPVTTQPRNCSAPAHGCSTAPACASKYLGWAKRCSALTVNAAAEKIIRQELQRLGAPARFMVVPGEASAQAAAPMAAPLAGSIQEAALAHPLVQRAKEIFKAEVRSVVDLRQK